MQLPMGKQSLVLVTPSPHQRHKIASIAAWARSRSLFVSASVVGDN
jgi:hypothetical protein